VRACRGDDRPDCPIIETLASKDVVRTASVHSGHGRKIGLQPKRQSTIRA
jgi:hypothetical protein